ncbi:hypothetical protein [Spiribacter salinus]|uniref:hypothetical protein n=1 Tax=Spiribacter salinus TaxID=1335746 RepID=UPI001C95ED2C|nr:hypothetical protein [Spiribacter salinus]
MDLDAFQVSLNSMSAALAFFAAGLWYRSVKVRVPPSDQQDEDGMNPLSIVMDDGSDFIETAKAQSRWNRYAALAAASAAVFQGGAIFLGLI